MISTKNFYSYSLTINYDLVKLLDGENKIK